MTSSANEGVDRRGTSEMACVGIDWLPYSVEEAKEAPCNSAMIAWLKLHPEWRKKIREEMMKSPLDTMISQ